MRIVYRGAATVRVMGGYRWSRESGYVQDVREPELIAEALTQPGEHFAVSEDDPLAQVVGPEQAALLALDAGLTTAEAYYARSAVSQLEATAQHIEESEEDEQ